MLSRLRRAVGAPLLRYFDFRFSEVTARIDEVRELLLWRPDLASGGIERTRSEALGSLDLSLHNAGNTPPEFGNVVSQAVSIAQFEDPDLQRLAQLLTGCERPLPWTVDHWPLGQVERKLWEWCFILNAAERSGKLTPDTEAVGFGVGTEPVPAALARFGVRVLATDREPAASSHWAESAQHMGDLRSLSKPHIVSKEHLERQVQTRYVDMNDVPSDLGSFDLIWSSCAMEHLGSPEAGIDFVLRTLKHLEPGGIAVHTTEFELTSKESTADYGHLAIYRTVDLERLRDAVRSNGCVMRSNWYVSLETPADRWICIPPYSDDDPVHLKLVLGDSVSTSVGIVIERPSGL